MTISTAFKHAVIRSRVQRANGAYSRLRSIEEWENLSQKEILERQSRALIATLSWAARHVPYYRDHLADFPLLSITSRLNLSRFAQLPPLDRETIGYHLEGLKSNDLDRRKWAYVPCAGAGASPVPLVQDAESDSWGFATSIAFSVWAGFRPGDKWIGIDSGIDLDEVMPWRSLASGKVGNGLVLSDEDVTPKTLGDYLDKIRRMRPQLLCGNSVRLYELAAMAERLGLGEAPVHTVIAGAEPLTPAMREQISRVFGANVFRHYGVRELPAIAGECQAHQGLHVVAPNYYVEIIRPDGSPAAPGELGQLVVTSLRARAMPLIRYRTGAMAAWSEEECACGRQWPLLKQVSPVNEVLFRVDGTAMPIEDLMQVTDQMFRPWWVARFKILPGPFGSLRVLLVPASAEVVHSPGFQETLQKAAAGLRKVAGDECDISFELVNALPHEHYGQRQAASAESQGEQCSD